jgi:hypothetical protein
MDIKIDLNRSHREETIRLNDAGCTPYVQYNYTLTVSPAVLAILGALQNNLLLVVEAFWNSLTSLDWLLFEAFVQDEPINIAYDAESWDVVKWLLANKQSWSYDCDHGLTYAIAGCIEIKKFDVAMAIIEAAEPGINYDDAKGGVNYVDGEHHTPLMRAVECSYSADTVLKLLELGADPTIVGHGKRTALDMASTPEIREILTKAIAEWNDIKK